MGLVKEQAIGADWLRDGDLAREEIDSIIHWYSDFHGLGDMTLAPFAAFWLEHDHGVFKRFRRWIESAIQEGFPPAAGALSHLHYYVVTGFDRGALYEIVAARKWGATKQQVLDAMAHGFLHAGPAGMSPPAVMCTEYLKAWTSDGEYPPIPWPEGWAVDPGAFDSGLDFSTRSLTDAETESLRAWYLENQGEVPAYVDFMARYSPEGLKSFRARYEYPTATLPKQLVPLLTFHAAANLGKTGAMRRAAHQARHVGVTRQQIMLVVARSFVYTSDLSMDVVADVIGPMFEEWPE